MRLLLVISLLGCALYFFLSSSPPIKVVARQTTAIQAPTPNPHAAIKDEINAQIATLFTPLPTTPRGKVPLSDSVEKLQSLRRKIAELYKVASPEQQAKYLAAIKTCDLLINTATQRNNFIIRLNNNQNNTEASALAGSLTVTGTVSTPQNRNKNWSPPQIRQAMKNKANEKAQETDRQSRIATFERAIQIQWNDLSQQLLKNVQFNYNRYEN